MDVRKFLRRVRDERTELEILLMKRDNITVIHGISYTGDRVMSSHNSDISDITIKNARLLNVIDRKIKRFKENQQKAMDMIYILPDSVHRQVMIMYYLSRKETPYSRLTFPYSLEEVSQAMCLSFNRVRHIHGEALQTLRKKKKQKEKAPG